MSSSAIFISGSAASEASYSLGEEIANAVTHGVAAVASIAGLAVLVSFAAVYSGSGKVVAAVSVFGASMIFLYTCSTLYHAVAHKPTKHILQILDHSMIYVLIAGSYTPFCLVTLDGATGIGLCIAEWVLALIGVLFQGILMRRDWANCVLCLVMGWLIVVVIQPLLDNLATGGLWLLVAGGIAYSVGVIFYVWERIPYGHAIWHVFVFAGTVLQFLSILLYVIPGVL